MNGFNNKVVYKNSSVTIWEILFNIAILIIHHKLYLNGGGGGRGFATTRGENDGTCFTTLKFHFKVLNNWVALIPVENKMLTNSSRNLGQTI